MKLLSPKCFSLKITAQDIRGNSSVLASLVQILHLFERRT